MHAARNRTLVIVKVSHLCTTNFMNYIPIFLQLLKNSLSKQIRGQGVHFVFFYRSAQITQTWKSTLRSCLLSSFVEFRLVNSKEKSTMAQPMRGQGGHLVFPIGPKNTNFVEDVGILLPVKLCWIPLSGFREVENISANQGSGQPSCFSDRPEKHKIGRERWNLASKQDSLNSVQAISAEKSKMSQPIRGQGGQLVFLISPKNTYVVKDVEILLPVKFRWILFSGEVENDLSDLTRTMWCDVYRYHYRYSLLINIILSNRIRGAMNIASG